jgi:hypothetical protein
MMLHAQPLDHARECAGINGARNLHRMSTLAMLKGRRINAIAAL